jgi:hypothetical protein
MFPFTVGPELELEVGVGVEVGAGFVAVEVGVGLGPKFVVVPEAGLGEKLSDWLVKSQPDKSDRVDKPIASTLKFMLLKEPLLNKRYRK